MNSTYAGDSFRGMISVNIPDTSRQLDRAAKILAGFPGALNKASQSALKRAASSGMSMAAKEVNKQYFLTTGDFKKYTSSYQKVQLSDSGTSVNLFFRGYHVPLIRFKARMGSDGRYHTTVMRSSTGDVLRHAFKAEMASGHVGLWERVGKPRLPIEEKWGPSVPQMMGANINLADAVGADIAQKFEKNLDHEVTAILNGWRS